MDSVIVYKNYWQCSGKEDEYNRQQTKKGRVRGIIISSTALYLRSIINLTASNLRLSLQIRGRTTIEAYPVNSV
jgi:hypothetical protein